MKTDNQSNTDDSMPDMPRGPTTTGDAMMSLFDLNSLMDAETRTDIPSGYVELYSMTLTVAKGIYDRGFKKGALRIRDLIKHNLRLRVAVKGKRTKDSLIPMQYELHRDTKKLEDKPKV